MRDRGVFSMRRALPRMSWTPKNLYNLWKRTMGPRADDLRFRSTASTTLFQQRWRSKALVRAFHGDFIPEKIFKRWYLPETLPDVRPKRSTAPSSDDKTALEDFARRKQREKTFEEEIEAKGMAPVGSLMLSEVERRIDVFLFRCCFVHSVYEARRLVIHGDVLLNGKKHTNANTRLAPGDMVTVNPDAIRFFKKIPGQEDNIVERLLKAPKKQTRLEKAVAEFDAAKEAAAQQEASEQAATVQESSADVETASSQPVAAVEADIQTEATPTAKNDKELTPFSLPHYASPWLFIPAYIEPSFSTCSAVYVRHPTARPGYSEIPTPYDADGALIRYAWEWYVQRRPRVRSKSQLARMPEDRARNIQQEIRAPKTGSLHNLERWKRVLQQASELQESKKRSTV